MDGWAMKRLVILFLLFTIPAQAGPLHWLKQQFVEHPTRTAFVVGGAAATIHGLALAHCREGSVENCQAKYGAAWKSFGFATGANLAVITSTHGCWKDQPAKFCSLFAYGGSAAQAGFAVSQWRKRAPALDVH